VGPQEVVVGALVEEEVEVVVVEVGSMLNAEFVLVAHSLKREAKFSY